MFSGRQTRRGKSQSPVAWVALVEETKPMKPTDKAILGMVSKSSGRNESEPIDGLENEKPRSPSPHFKGEGSMAWRRLAEALGHSGGVLEAARSGTEPHQHQVADPRGPLPQIVPAGTGTLACGPGRERDQNECSRSPESVFRMPGIDVHDGLESVFRMGRNTQKKIEAIAYFFKSLFYGIVWGY